MSHLRRADLADFHGATELTGHGGSSAMPSADMDPFVGVGMTRAVLGACVVKLM